VTDIYVPQNIFLVKLNFLISLTQSKCASMTIALDSQLVDLLPIVTHVTGNVWMCSWLKLLMCIRKNRVLCEHGIALH